MTNSGTESRTWEPAPGCCCGIGGGDGEERFLFCLDRKEGEEDLGSLAVTMMLGKTLLGQVGLLPPNFSF
jgi:hypothetical protein